MQLIGMLDSPYVRRVAVSLRRMGLPFEHRSISVFRTFTEFQAINPVVKAPSLVCDDGEVLMDSTLILDYAEALAGPERSLMPRAIGERQQALRQIGLALAACEKTVQIVYEHELRPSEKRHQPWLDRVQGQLAAAYGALEAQLQRHPRVAESATLDQAGISAAVAWSFTQMILPGQADPAAHPALHAFTERAEQLPEFLAFPQK
ncbi:MAG TPA: glutathione S-transferase [Albitalea sp.]|uniref:glutathione S-transferase n=1 Tax=Piscinibacter sp. TaxID=1903157 RepID=UPI002ED38114